MEEDGEDSRNDNDSDVDDDARHSVAAGMYQNLFIFLFASN